MRRRVFISLLGGAAAWPLAARAQQPAMLVIGFLSADSLQLDGIRLAGLRQGLKESGYVEGRNLAIEYRGAEGQPERLPALAADLIHHPVSVIMTAGVTAAIAAKAATTTVPIVFTIAGDPVELGLVASVKSPGGNVTGVDSLTSTAISKQIELLHEIVPGEAPLGLLVNPTSTLAEIEIRQVQATAQAIELSAFRPAGQALIDTSVAEVVANSTRGVGLRLDVPRQPGGRHGSLSPA